MQSQVTGIENPITGERVTFKKRASDTDGALLEFELTLSSREKAVPKHVHAVQEEHISVVSGAVLLTLGSENRRLVGGESAVLPRGIAHTLWNEGEQDAVIIVRSSPR